MKGKGKLNKLGAFKGEKNSGGRKKKNMCGTKAERQRNRPKVDKIGKCGKAGIAASAENADDEEIGNRFKRKEKCEHQKHFLRRFDSIGA